MATEPEIIAEPGAECADGRDVHSEVDEYYRKPGGAGEIPECARAAVGIGQQQSEYKRERGETADGHDRGMAAGKAGKRSREDPFASHGEKDPDNGVDRCGDETKAGEDDHEVDDEQRRWRPVPAGEILQRAVLLGEAEDI